MRELFKENDIVVGWDTSTSVLAKGIVRYDQVGEYDMISVLTFGGVKIYSPEYVIKIA